MVVIAIIALLLAILVPSLTRARHAAYASVCLNNVRRISNAAQMYITEHIYFPPHRMKFKWPSGPIFVNKFGRSRPRWQWFFHEGVGPVIDPTPYVLYPGQTFDDDQTMLMTNDYFICPAFDHPNWDARDIRNGSYGYNYQYLGNIQEITEDGLEIYVNYPVKVDRIEKPDKTIIIADGRGSTIMDPSGQQTLHGEHSYKLDPPRLPISLRARYFGDRKKPTLAEQHTPAEDRHLGLVCVSFLDGHADKMTREEMGYVVDYSRNEDGWIVANQGTNRLWNGRETDEPRPWPR
ncbi:MAG: hypothetical protein AMJ79_10525 [Phycisphaerae bacterium SM23_30]|nr:MAG: hypothetical protein AMJ79_10525 [Phycisphaerae bacterium SM23_30]